jgi:hypothetical protein
MKEDDMRNQKKIDVLSILFAGCMILVAQPGLAQSTVFRTKGSASSTWNPKLALTIGTGVDFESSDEEKAGAFPLLVEYNFTQRLRVIGESAFAFVDSHDPEIGNIRGMDDLETSIEYEAIRERRYTPSITTVGMVKWQTASDEDLGSPGTDFSVGLIASKDFGTFEMDSNLLYTLSGDSESPDLMEASLAVSYPLNHFFDLQAEVVRTVGTSGPDKGGADELEGTVGFAWQFTPFQTLESGLLRKDDGTWGVLVGWQYSFGGD